jgi:hypothetical protein
LPHGRPGRPRPLFAGEHGGRRDDALHLGALAVAVQADVAAGAERRLGAGARLAPASGFDAAEARARLDAGLAAAA